MSDYGYWDEDPAFPLDEWRYEVALGDTRLGYWDWVTLQHGLAQHTASCQSDIED